MKRYEKNDPVNYKILGFYFNCDNFVCKTKPKKMLADLKKNSWIFFNLMEIANFVGGKFLKF